MARSSGFADYVGDTLAHCLGEAEPRRMFGGWGVFHQGLMIALIVDDVLYMKVDDDTRGRYADAGSEPFSYARAGKVATLGSYWRLPDGLLDDTEALAEWAVAAAEAALRAARSKPPRRAPHKT